MLHTRTEAIKNESLNDEAEEDKGNNKFSHFIVNKYSNNITLGFYRIAQWFKNLQSFFTKSIHQFKDIWGKDIFQIIFLKFFFLYY